MSYLYLIIPPVVIVISLSILLVLISRKSQRILEEKYRGSEGISGTIKEKSILENGASGVNQLTLRISEKLAHNFKIFSLKLHNLIERWLRSIKEKKENGNRERLVEEKIKQEEKTITENNSAPASTIGKSISPGRLARFSRLRKSRKTDIITEEGQKEIIHAVSEPAAPIIRRRKGAMVSRAAVYPEIPMTERKDELEEILIERIASDPRDIEAYERLGDYYYGRRNIKDATDCYRQVLKLNPINRAVKIKLRRAERGFRSF